MPIIKALEVEGKRRIFCVLPRRSGKDITALNLALRQLLRKICTVFYIFPTFAQARKSMWDAIDIDGRKILDHYIPKEVIHAKNSSEMKIVLKNGSTLQFIGSENYDRLRGTNPFGVIFSEYATQNPMAYSTVRPILAANNGWVMFLSTPFGRNHFWDLYQIAQNSPDWFDYFLTLDDTQHIPQAEIDSLRTSGEMSEEMIQQEFYCSFTQGVEGSYYGRILNNLKLNNQITHVPYETSFPVHTAWDIGYSDYTTVIFFQVIGKAVHIIDYYQNNNEPMAFYMKMLLSKPYANSYGKHIAPHDIVNKNSSNGLSPLQIASQLGVTFTCGLDRGMSGKGLSRQGGIEVVRAKLPTFWIDIDKCSVLIKVLENYRKEFDTKKVIFNDNPVHDWASHGADAMRVLCTSLNLIRKGTSPEELNARYNRVIYGIDSSGPKLF